VSVGLDPLGRFQITAIEVDDLIGYEPILVIVHSLGTHLESGDQQRGGHIFLIKHRGLSHLRVIREDYRGLASLRSAHDQSLSAAGDYDAFDFGGFCLIAPKSRDP